jgi:hypothetical protein
MATSLRPSSYIKYNTEYFYKGGGRKEQTQNTRAFSIWRSKTTEEVFSMSLQENNSHEYKHSERTLWAIWY